MAKVILGNHTAVFAARSDQDRIRKFYCDVLGCKVRVTNDEVDRFQLDDLHICFVWQNTALDESNFLRATYLELKTDNTEEMKQKILAFGVEKLDVPMRTFISRLQAGRCFVSWVSTKTSPCMRGHLHQNLDRPRRHST